VSYPIAVLATVALLIPLHWVIVKTQLGTLAQLLLALTSGIIGGVIVNQVLGPNVPIISRLSIEYGSFGALCAVLCWTLYNWGPLRQSREQAL
jgi:tetrahydromethanopterin S-methyltransferase subunit C